MRFIIKDKEIVIRFEYSRKKNGKKNDNNVSTRCMILSGKPNERDEDKAKIGDCTVRRDSRDIPNFVVARYHAAKMAIEKAVGLSNEDKLDIWAEIESRMRLPQPYPDNEPYATNGSVSFLEVR